MTLLGLILGGDFLLHFFEEVGFLTLEWAHKMLDMLFEDVLGFNEEASKKASAYSGISLLIVLTGWGGYTLYQLWLNLMASFPQWWAELKVEFNHWWTGLPLMLKLIYAASVFGLMGILVMFIG